MNSRITKNRSELCDVSSPIQYMCIGSFVVVDQVAIKVCNSDSNWAARSYFEKFDLFFKLLMILLRQTPQIDCSLQRFVNSSFKD